MFTYRQNKQVLEDSLYRPFITAIMGPRRVGKTTFITHFAKDHPEFLWVFLNMDNMREHERVVNQELEAMIAENAQQNLGKTKIWVVIDEAQKCPELFNQIKILYDRYKDQNKIKLILTGSAVLSLHQLTSETLAGRIELHHLNEFTLRESALYFEPKVPRNSILDILSENPEQIKDLIHELNPFRPILEQRLQHLLIWGGFPELENCQNNNEKILYLNNYIQTYLEKDVRAIETISDIQLYRHLMDIVAQQTGSIREDKRIHQALGCSKETLKKYRGYLEATLLYRDIYPFIGSAMKRLVKSPKGYLLNNGLLSILTGFTQLPLLINSGLIGHRLENWFLNELSTFLARHPARSEIYYWRLSSGTEVDFIVEQKPHVFPFEVTYGSSPDSKKIRALKTFLSNEPKAEWGYYVYQGDFKVDLENRICFLPAWVIA